MASLVDRFEAKVDRSGEHHLWTGSKKVDGTGKLKVDGKAVTAQRVAWELANGVLPSGAQVAPCPAAKSCVRIEHLSLIRTQPRAGARGSAKPRGRARKGLNREQ